jgi:hypothetical protein
MWSRLCTSVSHSVVLNSYCVVSVCGPVYALVYPTVMGRSSGCVCLWSSLCSNVSHSVGSSSCYVFVCVCVCGPVYALVCPIMLGRFFCCVVCGPI